MIIICVDRDTFFFMAKGSSFFNSGDSSLAKLFLSSDDQYGQA